MDERLEALKTEQAIRDERDTAIREKSGIPDVVSPTKQEVKSEPEVKSEEIMIPKYRYDEIASKYNELKNQKEVIAPIPNQNIDALIDEKIRPIKIQLEVDQVLKAHPDFNEFAQKALDRIKSKPSLSLEEAYQLEKFSSLESKAKEEGKNEAYKNIEKKSSLQGEAQSRKAEAPDLDDLVRDKSVPLSEIAKMLPRG